jgi:ferredoxin-fold anticodon binding domain-containing protein
MEELKNTGATNRSEYMNFVVKFHKMMLDKKITLIYEGEVTQEITKAFTSMTEKNLDKVEEDGKIKKKVYHVMVECLQNISKHADDDTQTASDSLEEGLAKTGIFLIGNDQNQYFITSGNGIANENIPALKSLIDNINSLNQDELKQLHKEKMRETAISDKGGAGLGFIDIARKTGNPLEYHFEPIDDKNSFFLLKTIISRNSNEQ